MLFGFLSTITINPYIFSTTKAFTLAFDHEAYNEEPLAREMAAHTGANLQTIPIRQSDLAEHFGSASNKCGIGRVEGISHLQLVHAMPFV